MNYCKRNNVFFSLIICSICFLAMESCFIVGVEKVTIRKSVFSHTNDEILFKAKLYTLTDTNGEQISFPMPSIATVNTMDRPNEDRKALYNTVEYQPTILFLTKERFILNMGCTIYGQLLANDDNSFDVMYVESSIDCQSKELSVIETKVINTITTANKCFIENNVIFFYKGKKLLMVYHII